MYKYCYSYFKDKNDNKYMICREISCQDKKCFIIDEKDNKIQIPNASYIKYDEESGLIFVRDNVPVFNDYTCHISYFLDLKGNLAGPCQCDYDGRLINPVFHIDDEVVPFLGYELFKIKLKVNIANELYACKGDLMVGQMRMLRNTKSA